LNTDNHTRLIRPIHDKIDLYMAQIADAARAMRVFNTVSLSFEELNRRDELLNQTMAYVIKNIRDIDEQTAKLSTRQTELTGHLADLVTSPFGNLEAVRCRLLC
jgi:hypothetical protein